MNQVKRRDFLKSVSALGAASLVPGRWSDAYAQEENVGQWYRGNLHLHTQWSDGKPFPEWVVAWYKEQGYHFLCTSDHNGFQSDDFRFSAWCGACEPPKDKTAFDGATSRWKELGKEPGWGVLTQEHVDQMIDKFGPDSLQTKTVEGRTFYRLTPFDELDKKFAEPGRFLLIPGFEQTGASKDGHQVHMNFINVRSFFPYIDGEDTQKTVDANFVRGQELFKNNESPYMFTLNHPIWRFYDVDPRVLIQNANIRFFEINNNGLSYDKVDSGWTPDTYWDLVNAYRVTAGQQLLLATGTDDEHGYQREVPRAWMMVRAKQLAFPDLLAAMDRGDSYTSNGLDFENISFDRTSGKLSVQVKPLENRKIRIDFLGTKKDTDRTIADVQVEARDKQPSRTMPTWSPEIGRVLHSVEGLEANYTLQADDLYVRARAVTIDEPQQYQDKYPVIPRPGAWTQPWSLLVR